MDHILFDDQKWSDLLPLTYTRPSAELRIGILTIREKWEKTLGVEFSHITKPHLSEKYDLTSSDDNLLINGRLCPTSEFIQKLGSLSMGEALVTNGNLLAFRTDSKGLEDFNFETVSGTELNIEGTLLSHPWDIFNKNGHELELDFNLLTQNRESQSLSSTNTIIGNGRIFIEEGAKVEGTILSTSNGSIYIGKYSEVMEGAVIRGPFALCNDSTVKMAAKIYGATTVGPHSKVGGEVNNSVIQGYSNKGHDGFLGNSVLGEWCNLGADTNNSNLKNNYSLIDCWNYTTASYINTDLQFCGLIMGDHSKTGINTMFNTGTVVGVSCNIFGAGFPLKHVPSFSWGSAGRMGTYRPDRALDTAQKMMERRDVELTKVETDLLTEVFRMTEQQRN